MAGTSVDTRDVSKAATMVVSMVLKMADKSVA